jgi:hypothetical protein
VDPNRKQPLGGGGGEAAGNMERLHRCGFDTLIRTTVPTRRRGSRYKLLGHGSPEGGPKTDYVAYGKKVESKVHPRTGHEGSAGEYMYKFTLSLVSVLDGMGGQRHAPAALPPGKARYPLYGRLGRPQGRSGQLRRISLPTWI